MYFVHQIFPVFKFLFKRFIYLLITLPLVILISLLVHKATPYDPVENKIDRGDFSFDRNEYRKIYRETAKLYNLDLPLFYFSVKTNNYKSDYFDLILPDEKAFYSRFLQESFDYNAIDAFYKKIEVADNAIGDLANKSTNKELIRAIEFSANSDELATNVEKLESKNPLLYQVIDSEYELLTNSRKRSYKLLPKLFWHGFQSQYHKDLLMVFSLDFGLSFRDGQSVASRVSHAFMITFLMSFLGLIFAFSLGIWLGRKLVLYDNSWWVKWVEGVMFVLASIPLFWFATLVFIFFTTPEYGQSLDLFPIVSSFDFSIKNGFWTSILGNIHQLVLPILCVVLLSLAFVTRQTKALVMAEIGNKAYIITAKMKGLDQRKVINKHAFGNTKLQIVTMISSSIIGSFSGAVILEYIFNIPGIGRLLLDSIRSADWPILLCIIVVIFVLTSIVLAVSDIIYNQIDPRLKMTSND